MICVNITKCNIIEFKIYEYYYGIFYIYSLRKNVRFLASNSFFLPTVSICFKWIFLRCVKSSRIYSSPRIIERWKKKEERWDKMAHVAVRRNWLAWHNSKKFPPKGVDGIVGTREIVGIARKTSRKNSIPIGLVPGLHIPRGSRETCEKKEIFEIPTL